MAALPVLAASFYCPVAIMDYHTDALMLIPMAGVFCLSAFKASSTLPE